MRSFGIIARKPEDYVRDTVARAVNYLLAHGHKVYAEEHLRFPASPVGIVFASAEKVAHESELLVAIGGDGTLLRAAYAAQDRSCDVMGVNLGGLGFLNEIEPSEMENAFAAYLTDKASWVERAKLWVELVRGGKRILKEEILNDAVINKEALARIMDLETYVDGQLLTQFRADGLIVATPTGSTAYNVSAGGPILHPTLKAIALTPICPHALNYRPLILPDDKRLTIKIPNARAPSFLTLNGQTGHSLQGGDEINIWVSEHVVRSMESPKASYYQLLREKLHWGDR